MPSVLRLTAGLIVLGLLAGCTVTGSVEIKSMPKGAQVDVRSLLATHSGQIACYGYDADSNSCASLVTLTVSGDRMTAQEVGMIRDVATGGVRRIEVVSRSHVVDGRTCVTPIDVRLSAAGEPSQSAVTLLEGARDLMNNFGGEICATYYRGPDGYIVRNNGRTGQPFPPGDITMTFPSEPVKLRVR